MADAAGLPQATDDSWAYVLDDTGVYGPGWWPFYTDRSSPQARWATEATPQPCGVRLAPEVAFYAWHTEYLSLYPTDETGMVDGACHVVPSDRSRHKAERTAFRLRTVGDGWTAEPIGSLPHSQDILAEKTRRAINFLHAAIAERDRGAKQPTTAADLHTAEHETATTGQDPTTPATQTRPTRPPRPSAADRRQPPLTRTAKPHTP